MATIDNYKVKIDVEGQGAIDRLKNSLGGLGSVIAGIGFGAFIAGAVRAADAMSDLADATGLTIGYIAKFKEGISLAGGSADDATALITTFFQSLDKAAQGTESAQKALKNVGISLNDLKTLSEEELLDKAIANLSEMDAGAQRTAIGMEILGKRFRTMDPAALREALDTGNFDKLQASAKATAQALDNIHHAYSQIQNAAIQALGPLAKQIADIHVTSAQMEVLFKAVGAAIAFAFGAKVAGTIIDIIGAISKLNAALKATFTISAAMQGIGGLKGIAQLTAGAAAAAFAVYKLNQALEDTVEKESDIGTGKLPETGKGAGAFPQAQLYSDAELQSRKTALETAKQMTDQLARQNVQAEYYQQTINDTIGLMDVEASKIKMNAQLDQDAANKLIDLNKQIEIEKSKGRATNQGVIVELEKQKDEVNKHLEITKRLKQEEIERLEFLKQQNAEMGYMSQKIQDNVNLGVKQAQLNNQQLVIEGKITQMQADRFNELERIQADYFNKGKQLQEQLVKTTSESDRAIIEKKIQDLKTLEKTEIEYLMRKVDQEKAIRQSSTAGAIAALESIKRATDPFTVAQNSVLTLFRSMESAIDRFVDTGKLSFGDFAESVIKDLIKIQLKAAATNFMSAGLSMLGFGLPGMAAGGPVSGNTPYIVGEQGPELFIPKMAGNIVPNHKMGDVGSSQAQSSNTYITNNISAVDAKSVAQLFAENRKTLLGSVKMAEKEMPYRMR